MEDETLEKTLLKHLSLKLMYDEGCDSFKLELGDGKFVMAGTLEGIRNLVEIEGK